MTTETYAPAATDDPDTGNTPVNTAPNSTTHSSSDPAIGAGLGLVGGAIVGGVAGGPLGAVIGAVVGAVASDAAVVGVEHMEHARGGVDRANNAFDNSGGSTADYDAATGVTQGDRTIGDVSATDHTIFGSTDGELVDDGVPIGYRGSADTRNSALDGGTKGPTLP